MINTHKGTHLNNLPRIVVILAEVQVPIMSEINIISRD